MSLITCGAFQYRPKDDIKKLESMLYDKSGNFDPVKSMIEKTENETFETYRYNMLHCQAINIEKFIIKHANSKKFPWSTPFKVCFFSSEGIELILKETFSTYDSPIIPEECVKITKSETITIPVLQDQTYGDILFVFSYEPPKPKQ